MTPVIELDMHDWSAVQGALQAAADQLKEGEEKRTGGRGFASGGKAVHYQRLLRIRRTIKFEAGRQDYDEFLENHPDIAEAVEGIICSDPKCFGPISVTGCSKKGCPLRS